MNDRSQLVNISSKNNVSFRVSVTLDSDHELWLPPLACFVDENVREVTILEPQCGWHTSRITCRNDDAVFSKLFGAGYREGGIFVDFGDRTEGLRHTINITAQRV